MFEGQPKGLYALALANTGERFGYYTMLAVFALFLRANFGLDPAWAGEIYSDFLMLVYFLPIVGGWMADRFGYGRMVTIGIIIMFLGYLLLSFPFGGNMLALVVMLLALLLISLGTGLFKGNLQVMVGNLYDDPKYAQKRDAGFCLQPWIKNTMLRLTFFNSFFFSLRSLNGLRLFGFNSLLCVSFGKSIDTSQCGNHHDNCDNHKQPFHSQSSTSPFTSLLYHISSMFTTDYDIFGAFF